VKALFGNATVAGVEGPTQSGGATPDVDVRVGVARGRGRVVGAGGLPPSGVDGAYLAGLFDRLSDSGLDTERGKGDGLVLGYAGWRRRRGRATTFDA
jgi:hypothetical protein